MYKSGKDGDFHRGEIARSSYRLSLVLRELGEGERAQEMMGHAEGIRVDMSQGQPSTDPPEG